MQGYIDTFKAFQDAIAKAFAETLNMMLTSMVVMAIVGIGFGFLLFTTRANGLKPNRLVYFVTSGLINVVRSVPYILFIIVLIPFNRALIGTGFGVDSSKIPLSLMGIATFARFVERDLLDVDRNTYETAYALGASTSQFFSRFLLREARSGLVLSFTSATVSLLSYSTVMGIIGGGGLGYLAINEGHHNFNYQLMWIIIFLMILLVQIVQAVGNRIARLLDKR